MENEETPVHVFPPDGFDHLQTYDCICAPDVLIPLGSRDPVYIHNELVVPDSPPVDLAP